MSEPVFVDTSVLVYSRDAAHPEKQRKASEWMELLWETRRGRLSVQVLQEFYITTTVKLQPGLRPATARREVQDLAVWDPVPVDYR